MILNRDVHVCDMDIEKLDSTYFKITIKLSDGKIIANRVNFSNATIQQQEEKIEYKAGKEADNELYYAIVKYAYKIFLEGTCFKDDNGVALNISNELLK